MIVSAIKPDGDAAPDPAGVQTPTARPASSTAATGAVSASWAVPSNAVSGVYIAHLVRNDTRRRRARSCSWCATTPATPTSSCRPPTPPGRPTTPTAATASTSARSPARPATRWPTRPPTRSPTTGRSTRADDDGGARDLHYAEYPMIRFLERNGYDVSYVAERRRRPRRGAADQPQGLHLQRPRRVLVGRAARERRGRARRRRQPGVLQRQRGVLEDPLGERASTAPTPPTARWSPTRTRTSPRRSIHGPDVWTGTWRDPRFSPPADGGKPENALTGQDFRGQLRDGRQSRCPASTRSCASGATRRAASLGSTQTLTLAPGHARLRVGRRRRQRLPAGRSGSTSRRRPSAGSSCSPTTAAPRRTAAPPRTT